MNELINVYLYIYRSTEALVFFLMIFHWFLLACVPITSNEQKSIFGGQWTHYPILVIQSIYTLEMMCKIIAFGFIFSPKSPFKQKLPWKFPQLYKFTDTATPTLNEEINEKGGLSKSSTFIDEADQNFVRNHRAYLHSFANVLDLISIVSYWVDLLLMLIQYPNLSLFKSLGALRPIRLLSILPGTAVILKSLETSWDILLAVSGLILFFLLLFALVGLISFQGVFSRRCYFTDANSTCKSLLYYKRIIG